MEETIENTFDEEHVEFDTVDDYLKALKDFNDLMLREMEKKEE